MKVLTRAAMLLSVMLLAFPMLADEPVAESDADPQDAVFGADLFDDVRLAINHQAGTEFTVYASDVVVDADGAETSEFLSGSGWWPGSMASWRLMVDEDSASTESFYVNDSWQMDEPWSFEAEASETTDEN